MGKAGPERSFGVGAQRRAADVRRAIGEGPTPGGCFASTRIASTCRAARTPACDPTAPTADGPQAMIDHRDRDARAGRPDIRPIVTHALSRTFCTAGSSTPIRAALMALTTKPPFTWFHS